MGSGNLNEEGYDKGTLARSFHKLMLKGKVNQVMSLLNGLWGCASQDVGSCDIKQARMWGVM